MTTMLAALQTLSLGTLLPAVKQILDSGVTSIEQVRIVLSRLNDLPIPEQVETSLKLTEKPLADATRYDSPQLERPLMFDRHSHFKATKFQGMAECYAELQTQGQTGNFEDIGSKAWVLRQLLAAEATDPGILSVHYEMTSTKFPIHRDLLALAHPKSINNWLK